MSVIAIVAIAVSLFLVLALLYGLWDKKRLDKQNEEFSRDLQENNVRKPLVENLDCQIAFSSITMEFLFSRKNPKFRVLPFPTRFLDRYFNEVVKPKATQIVEAKILKGEMHPAYYDQPFVLVLDIDNHRVYMILEILYCAEENKHRCDEGLLEKSDRRVLTPIEKRELRMADLLSPYSDCHFCHNRHDCLHDEHHPCHEHQPCDPTCNAKEIYYFDPYDEKKLEAKWAKRQEAPTLDLDIEKDLGVGD